MFRPYPISFLQFGLFWIIVAMGAAALLRAFGRRDGADAANKSRLSSVGIALQAIGIASVGFGPMRMGLPWFAPSSLICAAVVALLGGGAIALFVAATRAMDRVLLWNFYAVPQFTYGFSRYARWDRFSHADPLPKYGRSGLPSLWWYDTEKAARIGKRS